jgi:hypothetical protein
MYDGYLELIYRCLSDDMLTELTRVRISYEEITYIYGKIHVIVVQMILKPEIIKLSYSVMFSSCYTLS